MSINRIREIYDERAMTYDRTVGFGERIVVGDLRQKFGAAMRGQTLEIAVGSGLNLPFYSAAVSTAIGIDLSSGMLTEARKRATSLERQISLIQMDAQELAFPDASFDTVAVSLALCTIPDPVAAFREIARVCRPDGRVVLLEHVLSPIWPIAVIQRLLSPLQERFIGCHLDRTTLDVARECGFQIESEEVRFAGIFRLAIAHPPAL